MLIIPLTSRGQANGRLTFRFTEERDGFGKLVKHKRKVRPGINPSTNQKIKIHAKTVLQFRVAKAAKSPVPPISASTPTDRIASCSALTRNWYLLPTSTLSPNSEPRTWRYLKLRRKNASQLSLAKASERPLVARINLHHAPGNSTTIEGKFDDWVRSIHS